jgi:hypothetical protein
MHTRVVVMSRGRDAAATVALPGLTQRRPLAPA